MSPMAILHCHPLRSPLLPVLTLYFRPLKLALPVTGFTLAFCPSVGAEISLRPLTPSNICFLGVAWPLAMLFALPRLYSIILSAASRSNGSPSDAAAVEGVGGMFSASSIAQSGSVGIENGLSGFEIGVNWIGTVVVVVTVRIECWLQKGDCWDACPCGGVDGRRGIVLVVMSSASVVGLACFKGEFVSHSSSSSSSCLSGDKSWIGDSAPNVWLRSASSHHGDVMLASRSLLRL